MSLVADYQSDSDNESENDESDITDTSTSDIQSDHENHSILPLPNLDGFKSNDPKLEKRKLDKDSIYSNPYFQKHEQTLSTLTKHKPLTESAKMEKKKYRQKKSHKKVKTKICTHFFKYSECKYGKDCKFLHSLQDVNADNDKDKTNQNRKSSVGENSCAPAFVSEPSVSKNLLKKASKITNMNYANNESIQHESLSRADGWDSEEKNKRKRVGLQNNLIPSKRVMKHYEQTNKDP